MVLLNATGVQVACPNHDIEFTIREQLRALGIILACGCQLAINQKTLTSVNATACQRSITTMALYSMLIPYKCSNLNTSFIKSQTLDVDLMSPQKFLNVY